MQTLITKKLNVLRYFSKQFHDSIFHYDLYFSKFRRKSLQKFDKTKKHFIEKYTFVIIKLFDRKSFDNRNDIFV